MAVDERDCPRWKDASLAQRSALLLILHTVGFCYWPTPWCYTTTSGAVKNGAAGLFCALHDWLLRDGDQFLDGFEAALGDGCEIALLKNRRDFLSALSSRAEARTFMQLADSALLESITGRKKMLDIATSDTDLLDIAMRIATMEGFNDAHGLPFYKRAQLLAWDLAVVNDGLPAAAARAERLTAFADYKIPQILRELGILRYADTLACKVDAGYEVIAGSDEELAVRAATVAAVEIIKQKTGLTAPQIDGALWLAAQNKTCMAPYHRCVTTAY